MIKFVLPILLILSFSGNTPKWKNCCWNTTESGLKYKIVNPGKGHKPIAGEEVKITWIWYSNKRGKVLQNFKKMFPEGQDWKVGETRFVKGFEEGYGLLNKGGSAFIKIPPELAYGDKGYQGEKTFCYYIEILE